MCQYIKDDGEQCGRTDHDGDYCWQHESDVGADSGESASSPPEQGSAVESDASDDSSFGTMDATCDQCGTSLRRRERLIEHPNVGRAVLFEAYVECDCSEVVLGAQSVSTTEVPDGWSN